jgi:glutaredoxin
MPAVHFMRRAIAMRARTVVPSIALTAALLAAASAWAQPYRTVGPDGRVTYSDIPLTADAGGGGTGNSRRSGAPASAALPYAVAQIAQKYPVTLYTSQDCAPCDSGRNLLTERGIPFTEKTITSNDDIAALKKIAHTASLPLLAIGGQQINGFQSDDWSGYLSAAGYPETSQLPGNYRRPAATPLAPASRTVAAAPTAAPAEPPAAPAPNTPIAPPPDPGNPAGIRF